MATRKDDLKAAMKTYRTKKIAIAEGKDGFPTVFDVHFSDDISFDRDVSWYQVEQYAKKWGYVILNEKGEVEIDPRKKAAN